MMMGRVGFLNLFFVEFETALQLCYSATALCAELAANRRIGSAIETDGRLRLG